MKLKSMTFVLTAFLLSAACTGCGATKMENNTDMAAEEAGKSKTFSALQVAPEKGAPAEDAAVEGAPAEVEEAYDAALDDEFVAVNGEILADAPDAADAPAAEAPAGEVGVLTAGEWNDHENWGFFTNLVNSGTISFPSFGIDPTSRIAVNVKNQDGTTLPNVKVQLLSDGGDVLWNAVSDKNGTAYLFEMNGHSGVSVSAAAPDGTQGNAEIAAVTEDEQGNAGAADRTVDIVLESEPVLYQNTQVMFIVDTTGSMGDVMSYLQMDFSAIAEETGDENTSYAVNFYRDEGDLYVTKSSGMFTSDVKEITTALNDEFADGGGDEPEAVAEALSEAFSLDGWADDAVKIAFLIYDAPPHTGKEDMLRDAVQSASEQGIHIVPVVSSNGSRESELFGRAAAICTNGRYVFLTDDSGVGESHLEPIIGDYEVESLHDIIVRIINDYKQ